MSKLPTAEETLRTLPATKLGIDDFYGVQTVCNAIESLESAIIAAGVRLVADVGKSCCLSHDRLLILRRVEP